jgi:hypothetical protein
MAHDKKTGATQQFHSKQIKQSYKAVTWAILFSSLNVIKNHLIPQKDKKLR